MALARKPQVEAEALDDLRLDDWAAYKRLDHSKFDPRASLGLKPRASSQAHAQLVSPSSTARSTVARTRKSKSSLVSTKNICLLVTIVTVCLFRATLTECQSEALQHHHHQVQTQQAGPVSGAPRRRRRLAGASRDTSEQPLLGRHSSHDAEGDEQDDDLDEDEDRQDAADDDRHLVRTGTPRAPWWLRAVPIHMSSRHLHVHRSSKSEQVPTTTSATTTSTKTTKGYSSGRVSPFGIEFSEFVEGANEDDDNDDQDEADNMIDIDPIDTSRHPKHPSNSSQVISKYPNHRDHHQHHHVHAYRRGAAHSDSLDLHMHERPYEYDVDREGSEDVDDDGDAEDLEQPDDREPHEDEQDDDELEEDMDLDDDLGLHGGRQAHRVSEGDDLALVGDRLVKDTEFEFGSLLPANSRHHENFVPKQQAKHRHPPRLVECNSVEAHEAGAFVCRDRLQCVLPRHRCDGVVDCGDASDELGCHGHERSASGGHSQRQTRHNIGGAHNEEASQAHKHNHRHPNRPAAERDTTTPWSTFIDNNARPQRVQDGERLAYASLRMHGHPRLDRIRIAHEERERHIERGLASFLMAIMLGVAVTGTLVAVVVHKMSTMKRRLALKQQRKSLVPDVESLIKTLSC